MGFQTVVNANQAPAVEGDFASQNPRHNVIGAAGQLVAPASGLKVGKFFFINPATGLCSQSYVAGVYTQVAFLARNSQGLITAFLADNTQVVPGGFMVVGFDGGDFWARFNGAISSGGTVYADETTGNPVASASTTATASAGFTGTASLVGASVVMTVVTQTAGVLNVGDALTGTGIPAGTTVASFGTYTKAAGTGTVNMSAAASATEAAEAVTSTSLFINATALLTGSLNVGDVITGTGVTSGTTITSTPAPESALPLSYGISVAQNFASTTVTGPVAISTGFTARSNGLQGDIVMIYAPA